MTRNEFLDDITTFGDLKSFCYDEECNILEDVYDEDERDEQINNCLMDWAREDSWGELYRRLDSIPTGYEWYCYNEYGEWFPLDDGDFETYKRDVLEWADDNEIWDADEDDDEDYDVFEDGEPDESDDEPAIEDEDFSVGDLIGMCCVAFATIQSEDARQAKEEEEEFRRLYPKVLK